MTATTIDSIFKPEELREARTTVYSDEIKALRMGSKRAPSPAERVALAELEQRLRAQFGELRAAGRVDYLPEGIAA